MPHYKYLILGGGMAADAAVKAIREIDGDGPIGMISAESDMPYKRPPLTKGLWKGKQVESIWLKTDEWNINAHLGTRISKLDASAKRLISDLGVEFTFDKLLLATGGTPRKFPFDTSENVIYYRTFADYQHLRSLAESGESFVVIGGGFIGSEIAAALRMNHKKVTLVFPEQYIGAKIYTPELGGFLNSYYREHGAEILPGENVASIEGNSAKSIVRLASGRELIADGVIAGLGITPNIELAQSAGLKVLTGIHVDDLLRTSNPDILSAGDAAEFYNSSLGKHMRVEHEDNAVTMGKYAGMSMAGEGQPYHYLPYFYSDLFDLGYEAVGEVDSRLDTIADWAEPFQKGVTYYMHDGRVRGALLWNVWDKVPAARELIAQLGPFTEADLKGKHSLMRE